MLTFLFSYRQDYLFIYLGVIGVKCILISLISFII